MAEIALWLGKLTQHPFHQRQLDQLFAMLTALTHNFNVQEQRQQRPMTDFLLWEDKPHNTVEDFDDSIMEAWAAGMAAAHQKQSQQE